MSFRRDDDGGARFRRALDDATAERLIAGTATGGTDDIARLSAFLDELRALGQGPPSPPSAALSRMLAGPSGPQAASSLWRLADDEVALPAAPVASNGHRPSARAGVGATSATQPSAGVALKAAVVALVATAGVTGAAAARVLPAPAQTAVSRVIETVTPFELRAAGEGGGAETMARQGAPFDPGHGDPTPALGSDRHPPPDDRLADRPAPASGGGPGEPVVGAGDPSIDDPSGEAAARGPGPGVSRGGTTPAGASPPRAPAPGHPSDNAPAAPARGATYTATLDGNAEPSGGGDPDGSGRASLILDARDRRVCVAVATSGIALVTNVHLHRASSPPTTLVNVGQAPAGDGAPSCVTVTGAVLRDIRTDPGSHYVEVHTAEFPDGALRGRLER